MPNRSGASSRGLELTEFQVEGEEFAILSWPLDAPSGPRPAFRCTDAERAVLRLLVDGASNVAIARARGCSPRTVANQVASLLRKAGARSRFELIALHRAR